VDPAGGGKSGNTEELHLEPLKRTDRVREYKDYPPNVRGQVAYAFLRDKKLGHRKIDQVFLGKDPEYTKGFQSMGILHYQGVVDVHHGVCEGMDVDGIVALFGTLRGSEYLVGDLLAYKNYVAVEQKRHDQEFQHAVEKSLKDQSRNRQQRLQAYDGKPQKIQTISYGFNRSPDVVAEALLRAGGICERCSKPAPFSRKSDGSPYLEVHHKLPLSEGGPDTLQNVIALCPNCHREVHFG